MSKPLSLINNQLKQKVNVPTSLLHTSTTIKSSLGGRAYTLTLMHASSKVQKPDDKGFRKINVSLMRKAVGRVKDHNNNEIVSVFKNEIQPASYKSNIFGQDRTLTEQYQNIFESLIFEYDLEDIQLSSKTKKVGKRIISIGYKLADWAEKAINSENKPFAQLKVMVVFGLLWKEKNIVRNLYSLIVDADSRGLNSVEYPVDKLLVYLALQDTFYATQDRETNRYIYWKQLSEEKLKPYFKVISEKTDYIANFKGIRSGRSIQSIRISFNRKANWSYFDHLKDDCQQTKIQLNALTELMGLQPVNLLSLGERNKIENEFYESVAKYKVDNLIKTVLETEKEGIDAAIAIRDYVLRMFKKSNVSPEKQAGYFAACLKKRAGLDEWRKEMEKKAQKERRKTQAQHIKNKAREKEKIEIENNKKIMMSFENLSQTKQRKLVKAFEEKGMSNTASSYYKKKGLTSPISAPPNIQSEFRTFLKKILKN